MQYRVRFTKGSDFTSGLLPLPVYPSFTRQEVKIYTYSWCRLLAEGSAVTCVTEDSRGSVVAWWLSCCVNSRVVDLLEQQSTLKALFSYIHSTVLNPRQIEKAHQGEGVNLVLLFKISNAIDHSARDYVSYLLFQSFLKIHRGLNVSSIFCEVHEERDRQNLRDMGFQECALTRQPYSSESVLMRASRSEILSSHRVCLPLYQLFRPKLISVKLSKLSRLVLQLAYFLNLTDAEVAHSLRTTEIAVRQRWCRIGKLLRQQGFSVQSGRASLLSFVEVHPEILQPTSLNRVIFSSGLPSIHFSTLSIS